MLPDGFSRLANLTVGNASWVDRLLNKANSDGAPRMADSFQGAGRDARSRDPSRRMPYECPHPAQEMESGRSATGWLTETLLACRPVSRDRRGRVLLAGWG